MFKRIKIEIDFGKKGMLERFCLLLDTVTTGQDGGISTQKIGSSMLYSLVLLVTGVLLAIWSTSVWILHSLLVWSMSGAGVLAGQTHRLESVAVPAWLAPWVPPEWLLTFKAAATGLLPWLESALSALPSAATWLAPLAWVVWAIGLVLLLAGAAIGQGLIWTTRRAARA